jgi:four helix bundle protein
MQLFVYSVALSALELVGPLARVIERSDRDLARQLRRASSSVLLNIAEGDGVRDGHRRQRLLTARGSSSEVVACLDAAAALGYLQAPDVAAAKDGFDHVGRMLSKLLPPIAESVASAELLGARRGLAFRNEPRRSRARREAPKPAAARRGRG